MVSEEMELNHVLEAAGIRPVETDLGEYIVQLAGQRPVHIVTPAMHMSAADVGQLFAEKLGEPFTAEHRNLTDIARRHLREEYLQAEHGHFGLQLRRGRHGHDRGRRERGQRRPLDRHAAGPRGPDGHREDAAADSAPAALAAAQYYLVTAADHEGDFAHADEFQIVVLKAMSKFQVDAFVGKKTFFDADIEWGELDVGNIAHT